MRSAVLSVIPSVAPVKASVREAHLHRMELFLYDSAKLALPEPCRPLHCGLLRLSGHGATGWAEFEFSDGTAHLDLIKWGQAFRHLKRRSAAEAEDYIRRHEAEWGFTRTHLAAEALHSWQHALGEMEQSRHPQPAVLSDMSGVTSLPTEREFLSYYCQSYYSF